MKKLLVGVLASALIVTMTAVPVAATDSLAGIEFTAGSLVPGEPGDVDGVVDNLNFYFGSQEISSANAEYDSEDNDAAPYNGMGETVGYIVTNNTGSTSQGWEVSVEITEFTQGASPTLQGFTLAMTPQAGYPKASSEASTVGNPAPSANTIELAAGSSNSRVLFNAGNGEGRGTWGANWTGKLKVLGGTAQTGEAKATMTWNLQAV